jgi:DNA-binding GntR family transcriptional regulator
MRNWRSQFYPLVEREIAMCLPFGCFSISATSLAREYGVSRTIAHETLVRLERLGLVRQQRARWFAGPLTDTDLRDHYEMRWLLEPRALQDAAPSLDPGAVLAMQQRAVSCLERVAELNEGEFDLLEQDLHEKIVLRCRNHQMAETIRRSQLPLMAINYSFRSYRGSKVLRKAILEHMDVLTALVAEDIAKAAHALEAHLRASLPVIRDALAMGSTQWGPPPYMEREK